ncbi:MAG: hypothetical protein GY899_03050 [Verrucomicrobiaceae bacterium]|nr:hypothetical protein [Verrucomicrobiaceae bacterium]
MEWIKENRFYAGYALVILVGVLALGFWVFKGRGAYDVALQEFKDTQRNVGLLSAEKVFPSQKNLTEKEARVSRYASAVDALQLQAGKLQRDLKDGYTEQQFRNLRNTDTKAVLDLAAKNNMELPKEFALGFNSYNQGVGVPPHAVAILEWEFDAIKRFVEIAVESGVESIDEFKRDMIPQERKDWKPVGEVPPKGRKPVRRPPRKPPVGRKRGRGNALAAELLHQLENEGNPMMTASSVMSTYRFTSKVTGSYESLTALLNKIASDENFFMWLRRVRIENQLKVSPQMVTEGAFPKMIKVPKPGAVANNNGELEEVDIEVDAEVIFGNEKMKAVLVIDLVRFKGGSSGQSGSPDKTSS